MLLQQVVLDADPEEAAAAAAREAAEHGMDWLTPRLLLDTHDFVLFAASAEDTAAELTTRGGRRWGVSAAGARTRRCGVGAGAGRRSGALQTIGRGSPSTVAHVVIPAAALRHLTPGPLSPLPGVD